MIIILKLMKEKKLFFEEKIIKEENPQFNIIFEKKLEKKKQF